MPTVMAQSFYKILPAKRMLYIMSFTSLIHANSSSHNIWPKFTVSDSLSIKTITSSSHLLTVSAFNLNPSTVLLHSLISNVSNMYLIVITIQTILLISLNVRHVASKRLHLLSGEIHFKALSTLAPLLLTLVVILVFYHLYNRINSILRNRQAFLRES